MADSSYNCSVENCHSPVLAKRLCNRHYIRWKKFGDPTRGRDRAAKGEPMAFLMNAMVSDTEKCILWPFARKSEGQGCLWVDGKLRVASQYVCEISHGPAPSETHQAAHSCGNGHLGCVNRKHLSWKTPSENQMDRVKHGTSNRGERHGLSKLTAEEVRLIRSMRGMKTHRELAAEYSVANQTIHEIMTRKIWGHL